MSDLQTSVGELTSDGMKRVLAAVGAVLKTCDRPDLDQRVRAAAHRYEQTHCYVLIAGEFKQGKSTLINALVNAPICPVDDDVSTARAIEIGYADAPIAEVVFNNSDPDELPETRPISFDDIPAASLTNPPLTTVMQDTRRAGELLVETLLRQIAGGTATNSVIPTRLVVRRSG